MPSMKKNAACSTSHSPRMNYTDLCELKWRFRAYEIKGIRSHAFALGVFVSTLMRLGECRLLIHLRRWLPVLAVVNHRTSFWIFDSEE